MRRTKFIQAHSSGLACIALSQDGKMVATASERGTLVRIHSTSDGAKLQVGYLLDLWLCVSVVVGAERCHVGWAVYTRVPRSRILPCRSCAEGQILHVYIALPSQGGSGPTGLHCRQTREPCTCSPWINGSQPLILALHQQATQDP